MSKTPEKKILFIHMGGTIGMKITDHGLEPPTDSKDYKEAILPTIERSFPNIDFNFVSLSTVDSNDINAEMLEELVAYIRANEDKYDGILITHGTDTLASTASTLNICFYDNNLASQLSTPIVLTASQSSIHDTPTDGKANLMHSVHALNALSGGTDGKYYPITAVVFRDLIINGAHVIKTSESGFDAFHSVAYKGLLGRTSAVGEHKLEWLNLPKSISITRSERSSRLHSMQNTPLQRGRLLLSPLQTNGNTIDGGGYVHVADIGTFGSAKSYSLQGKDPECLSILFRLTGIGNTGEKNYKPVSDIVETYGIPVYGALSIPGGNANMGEYAAGHSAYAAGIVSGADLSSALAEAKLNWILANGANTDTAAYVLEQMGNPYDLAKIFDFHADQGRIPQIYRKNPTDTDTCFGQRLAGAQSTIEAYRKFKGQRFRWLTVPTEQIEHAAKFLPAADTSKVLETHQNTDFAKLTDWSPENS